MTVCMRNASLPATMRKSGRPSKKNEATVSRFLEALRAGNTRRASCLYAGFSEDTLARWLAAFADFAEDVARAEAECEIRNVLLIQKAAQERDVVVRKRKVLPDGSVIEEVTTRKEFDVAAAQWWLERRRPQEWGRRDKLDVQGSVDLNASLMEIAQKVASRPVPTRHTQDENTDK